MENTIDKRKFEAVIEKYELEKDLKDIYVEGEEDRKFYANHYKQGDKHFIDISSIDFSTNKPELENSGLENGNRDKIIYLLDCLKNKSQKNIRGVIDKDILFYTREIPSNDFIFTTDYSCLEMYFFIEDNIKKVQENTLKNMSVEFVGDVMKKLQSITAVRIVEKQMKLSLRKPDICSCIIIDKNKKLSINEDKYIKCLFDMSDKKYKNQKEEFKNKVKECIKSIKNDNPRNTSNGHDLISALTYCVQKIEKNKGKDGKNEFQHMKDSFLTAIYKNAVETADMEKTELFKKISAF